MVITALAFVKTIDHAFATGQFLGFSFLATTVLLCSAELLTRRSRNENTLKKAEEMKWLDALVIGILQAIAILPGISRSGATISGALSRKLDRDFAARFSFLLSIPAILGAVVLHTRDLIKNSSAAEAASVANTASPGIGAAAIIIGTITAAIVGYFAIRLMLKIIREKSLFGFAIYTAILGTLVLIDQFGTKFVF
jgi:undecaprenyl-diphosphatase